MVVRLPLSMLNGGLLGGAIDMLLLVSTRQSVVEVCARDAADRQKDE